VKVTFVNPANDNELMSNIPTMFKTDRGRIPALGSLYLASEVRNKGYHEVGVIDATVDQLGYEEVAQKIKDDKVDVVGISVTSFSLVDTKLTADAIRKVCGDKIKIIMGGPHVVIYPDETVSALGADYAVAGEAEYAIHDVLEHIDRGKNGHERVWRQHKYIEDLDELPFPARDLTDYTKYWNLMSDVHPVTTAFSSRGCPFQCNFCDRPAMGRGFRAMSPTRVVDEMEECEKMGIKEIMFYDDTFTIMKDRVLGICQEYRKRNLTISWDVRSRVDTITQEMCKAMAEANCRRIHYGIEAGNQRVMDALNKEITVEQVEQTFGWTHDAGMECMGLFMIGNPTETRSDINETIKLAKRIKCDYVATGVLSPYPATALYLTAMKNKLIKYDVWKEYARTISSKFRPPLWLEIFTKEELISELKRFYRLFYLTPYYIIKSLLKMKNPFQFMKYIIAGTHMVYITTIQKFKR